MRSAWASVRWFLDGEDGPTAVEYAVMMALIIVVCVATISTLGLRISDVCDAVCAATGQKTT